MVQRWSTALARGLARLGAAANPIVRRVGVHLLVSLLRTAIWAAGDNGAVRLAFAAQETETMVGDVRDLRAFCLAVDLRSFTAVARLPRESKATISRRIARLDRA